MTSPAAVPPPGSLVPRPRRPPGAREPGAREDALHAVAVSAAVLRACSAALERDRDRAVEVAIAAGATWAQLGEALGVTPQAAHKRFRRLAIACRTGRSPGPEIPAPTPGPCHESPSPAGSPAPGIPPGQSVMVRLGRLAQLAQRSSDAAIAAPFGLGRTDSRVIRELSRHGALTGAELHRLCGVDKAGVSRAAHTLRRRGLVERVPDRDSGPARYRLTVAGWRHAREEIMPLAAARQSAVLRGLPADAVNIVLDALTRNLERMLSPRDPA